MPKSDFVERRRHPRKDCCAGVRFYHQDAQREFPARGADISQSGMLMYVPTSTPVQPGQPIRLLNLAPHSATREAPQEPVEATIVRVDREELLSKGYIAVGIRFQAKPGIAASQF